MTYSKNNAYTLILLAEIKRRIKYEHINECQFHAECTQPKLVWIIPLDHGLRLGMTG